MRSNISVSVVWSEVEDRPWIPYIPERRFALGGAFFGFSGELGEPSGVLPLSSIACSRGGGFGSRKSKNLGGSGVGPFPESRKLSRRGLVGEPGSPSNDVLLNRLHHVSERLSGAEGALDMTVLVGEIKLESDRSRLDFEAARIFDDPDDVLGRELVEFPYEPSDAAVITLMSG